jgi:Acyltransferase
MNWKYRYQSDGWLHDFLSYLTFWMLGVHYRRMYMHGLEHFPEGDVPAMIAANHPTAFIDPFTIGHYTARPLYYMTRGDIFRHPTARRILESINMFPVFRTKDGYSDKDRHDPVMEFCLNTLQKGRVICMFSEGQHHYDKRVLHAQKGIARIAFAAYEKFRQPDLQIVPVGLSFWYTDRTRDVNHTIFGPPLYIRDYWARYQQNPAATVLQLCRDIEQAIRPLCYHINDPADDALTEQLLTLARSTRPIGHFPVTVKHRREFDADQQVIAAVNNSSADEKMALSAQCDTYFQALEVTGLSDECVLNPHWFNPVRFIVLLVGLPLFLLGFLGRLPIGLLAHWVTERKVAKREFKSSIYCGIEFIIGALWYFSMFVAALFTLNPVWISLAAAMPLLAWFSRVYREVAARFFGALRVRWSGERPRLLNLRSDIQFPLAQP